MGRRGLSGALLVAILAACSGAGNTAATTTTTTSTTTTTRPTTTTAPEEAVKQAYLAYWAMIDRISAAPDPSDPEIEQRSVDPLLTSLRDDFGTRKEQGRFTRFPQDPALNAHRIDAVRACCVNGPIPDCPARVSRDVGHCGGGLQLRGGGA